jgi:hypothetical protein
MTCELLVAQIPLLDKVLRTIAVDLFLVLALRLAGKRELAQLNSFDLVVLLLSNTVQNALIGPDNSLLGACSARRCCRPPTTPPSAEGSSTRHCLGPWKAPRPCWSRRVGRWTATPPLSDHPGRN